MPSAVDASLFAAINLGFACDQTFLLTGNRKKLQINQISILLFSAYLNFRVL